MRKILRKGAPFVIIAASLAVFAACSSGANEALNEMDTPPVNYVEEGESLELEEEGVPEDEDEREEKGEEGDEESAVEETVNRELYLLDENGMVVPQTLPLPKSDGVLKQSLEYLVEGGPVTNLLPNGFQAVLPPDTEISVNLEDGVAVVDFSKEFTEYDGEKEQQILQSITWTLTQFENVEKVKLQVNGHELEKMPVNGTPIGDGYSRANGINLESGDVVDVVNSEAVTLYFLAQSGDQTYYVPVTRRVNVKDNSFATAVEELLNGPMVTSPLVTDFRNGVELLDEPKYENGVVTLNFNEALLSQMQATAVSDEIINMLALTLTEQDGVEKVAIQVNGETNILNEQGEFVAEPVSRPSQVNTGKF
ncbi:GerMN domain-containing protein [Halalkalibacterium halodurans]|uniref:GerMN domain-containing protein n=1 Tax=Halalkalibacterium halodurans TaxID=86665 RepID=UPI002E231C1A|nr:GerMN domain-containing protein [Halalkalibacterium halodurans]